MKKAAPLGAANFVGNKKRPARFPIPIALTQQGQGICAGRVFLFLIKERCGGHGDYSESPNLEQ
ncbi:hypothetical protein CL634_02885 [bacterium]|nr:hypothetical protein [bacterium]